MRNSKKLLYTAISLVYFSSFLSSESGCMDIHSLYTFLSCAEIRFGIRPTSSMLSIRFFFSVIMDAKGDSDWEAFESNMVESNFVKMFGLVCIKILLPIFQIRRTYY